MGRTHTHTHTHTHTQSMEYLTIFIEQLKDSVYHVWIQCLTRRDANSSLKFLCKRNKIKYRGVSLLRKLREKPRRERPKGKKQTKTPQLNACLY